MAGLSDFFGAEQKRKRKLFKGEGYPESAAKRAEDRAAALAKEKARAEARAAAKVVATEESTAAEKVTAQGQRNNERAQRIGSYTAPTVKPTTAKFGVGNDKTVMHNGRSMANVTAAQLKETGLKSTEAYMRRWDETGARPAAGAKDKYKDAAVPKRGGTGESPKVKALRKYVEDEGERRAAETDSLNKEYNAKKGAPSRKFFQNATGQASPRMWRPYGSMPSSKLRGELIRGKMQKK
jgi:hypothetical protein